ncbi:MAG TPA: hypothetical protein VEW93_05125 [Acidimicrobiales bacterium]|nr:hypothetical protein [Acidimicrobiales bacterium]
MTTTTPGTYDPSYTERASQSVRRLTETKAGAKTTEFMLTVVFVVGVLVATYLDEDSLGREDGWRFASFAVVAYLISRGLAKLGVNERYTDDAR